MSEAVLFPPASAVRCWSRAQPARRRGASSWCFPAPPLHPPRGPLSSAERSDSRGHHGPRGIRFPLEVLGLKHQLWPSRACSPSPGRTPQSFPEATPRGSQVAAQGRGTKAVVGQVWRCPGRGASPGLSLPFHPTVTFVLQNLVVYKQHIVKYRQLYFQITSF